MDILTKTSRESEVEKREVEKSEVEKREVEKSEVEKREVEKSEVEKSEVEKREVEKSEVEIKVDIEGVTKGVTKNGTNKERKNVVGIAVRRVAK